MSIDKNDGVVRLYVVRRVLDGLGVPRFRKIAHSGVLLKTAAGSHYLLEYMADAKAHLTSVKPEEIKDKGDHLIIKMNGKAEDGIKSFTWTRQKTGAGLDGRFSPNLLRSKMQALMPSGYSVWDEEQCHTAQERLRIAIGVLSPKSS